MQTFPELHPEDHPPLLQAAIKLGFIIPVGQDSFHLSLLVNLEEGEIRRRLGARPCEHQRGSGSFGVGFDGRDRGSLLGRDGGDSLGGGFGRGGLF